MPLSDPIVIEQYNPEWPAIYHALETQIRATLGRAAAGIEHIGSTAVPDLAAKNIIDVDVAHRLPGLTRSTIKRLEVLGFDYYGSEGVPGRGFFRREPREPGDPAVHVHVFPEGHPSLDRDIAFREALRNDDALANSYCVLKRALALKHRNNLEAYNGGKEAFIVNVVGNRAEAARWSGLAQERAANQRPYREGDGLVA